MSFHGRSTPGNRRHDSLHGPFDNFIKILLPNITHSTLLRVLLFTLFTFLRVLLSVGHVTAKSQILCSSKPNLIGSILGLRSLLNYHLNTPMKTRKRPPT